MFQEQFCIYQTEGISSGDLWVNGIHLLNSGKFILGNNFVNELNRCIDNGNYFLGDLLTWIWKILSEMV